MKNLLLSAIIFIMGSQSFADSLRCSNADQTLKYTSESPPADVMPNKAVIELSLNSKVLYKTTEDGEGEVRGASYIFEPDLKKIFYTATGYSPNGNTSNSKSNILTTFYSTKLKLVLKDKIVSDFVICKEATVRTKR